MSTLLDPQIHGMGGDSTYRPADLCLDMHASRASHIVHPLFFLAWRLLIMLITPAVISDLCRHHLSGLRILRQRHRMDRPSFQTVPKCHRFSAGGPRHGPARMYRHPDRPADGDAPAQQQIGIGATLGGPLVLSTLGYAGRPA